VRTVAFVFPFAGNRTEDDIERVVAQEPFCWGAMIGQLAFALSILAILAVPGPTNTLLMTSGVSIGFRRSLRLVPAELSGYLIAILVISEIIGTTLWKWPWLAIPARLFVAGYLIGLATHLWGKVSLMDPSSGPISAKYVFVTTLLNPKAIVFALIVNNPLHSVHGLRRLLAFSALNLLMSLAWVLVGTAIDRGILPTGGYSTVCRVGASVIASFGLIAAWPAIAELFVIF
jgi:threonine/homoserine/homoserine lactone efflux protein